jgi:4-amino-4-deoxy-L-arabinose transferase-like glycosyltransferase
VGGRPLKSWHEGAALVAVCALLYLTGSGEVPFYTRGEAREGLVVREMLRSGEWLVPARPGGELARKPPLYYWTAAAATTLLGDPPERAMRLPSALLGTAGVLATWVAARRALPAGAALPAALILATSFEWTRAATSARVDMALAAPLALLLAAWSVGLARPDGTGRGRLVAIAVAAATLGTLGKGPVALVLPALAVGALLVRPRHRRAALGLRPVGDARRRLRRSRRSGTSSPSGARGGRSSTSSARENVLRFLGTDAADTGHAHGAPYLLALGLVGLLPWVPIVSFALAAPRSSVTALAAAWVVTGGVFLSLAASKRSVYLLPLYPALALLIAGGMTAARERGRALGVAQLAARAYPVVFLLIAIAAAAVAMGVDVAAPIRPLLKEDDAAGALALATAAREAAPVLLLLAVGTAAAAIAAELAARAHAWPRLALVVAAAFVAWTAFFNGVLHPAIGRRGSVREFLTRVGTIVPPGTPLHTRFPPDPAVRFYAPRDLVPWPDEHAAGGYVLLWENEWLSLRDARGEPLDVVAVSDATRSRNGHLALVRAPAAPVHAVPTPPRSPAPPAPDLRNRPD